MAIVQEGTAERSAGRIGGRPNWPLISVAALAFVVIALVITKLRGPDRFPFVPSDMGMALKPTPEQAPFLAGNQIGVTIGMTLIGLIGVGLGIRLAIKDRSVLPLAIALSGAMIVFPEVFFDVMGAVYFPYSETEPFGATFTMLGRTMPYWIVAGWFGYGVFTVTTYMMLRARPTTRVLWYGWGAALLGDIVFEEVLLNLDVYHYYGNQPLVLITELPWWWIPCNSVGVMLAASIAWRFKDGLRGWKPWAMLAVTPMSVPAVYGAIALPAWVATNSDFSWLPTQLLGFATLILGVFAFMAVLKFVLNRDPFDLDYRPDAENEFLRVN